MFNRNNYNENVDYCEYVFKKNLELNLGLETEEEIQRMANLYVIALDNMDMYSDDEVVENDELLENIVKEYVDDRNEKRANDEENDPYSYSQQQDLENRLKKERLYNSMGGYAMNEQYDDYSYEDLNDSSQPKL